MECYGRVQDAPLINVIILVHAKVESNPRENVVGSAQGSSFESKGAKVFSLKRFLFKTLNRTHINPDSHNVEILSQLSRHVTLDLPPCK